METKNQTNGHDQALEIDHNQRRENTMKNTISPNLQKVEKLSISVQEKIEKFEEKFILSSSNILVGDGLQKVIIYEKRNSLCQSFSQ